MIITVVMITIDIITVGDLREINGKKAMADGS